MTAAPTMKTAARETPSDETPSIGTGWASTNMAANRSARSPPVTARVADEAAKDQAARPARANPETDTGARRGKSRAVSFDTRPPGSFLPATRPMARRGSTLTLFLPVSRYQAQPSPSARNEARRVATTATYASFAFQ